MYIRTPESGSLAAPPATKPNVKSNSAPIAYGDQYITKSDASKVLDIIAGRPYQAYIHPVMATQVSPKLPKNFLRIVDSINEVPAHLRGRFLKVDNRMIGGTIDRPNGMIYMLPAPGQQGAARLEFVLHELVHLFAHPFMSVMDDEIFKSKFGTSCIQQLPDVGSFQRKFCFGLGEGATQVITEEFMEAQKIRRSTEKIYKVFVPPVRKLISIFTMERFARAYFWGALKELTDAMEQRWGFGEWRTVSKFIDDREPDKALDYIKGLEQAYAQRRGRKGAYLLLPSSKRSA